MKIDYREGVAILRIVGNLTIGWGDAELRDAVAIALKNSVRALVLDFSRLTTTDSSGLGELVNAHFNCMKQGVMFAIAAPSAKIREMFVVTELRTVFPVFATADDAVHELSRLTFERYLENVQKWTHRHENTDASVT